MFSTFLNFSKTISIVELNQLSSESTGNFSRLFMLLEINSLSSVHKQFSLVSNEVVEIVYSFKIHSISSMIPHISVKGFIKVSSVILIKNHKIKKISCTFEYNNISSKKPLEQGTEQSAYFNTPAIRGRSVSTLPHKHRLNPESFIPSYMSARLLLEGEKEQVFYV